MRYERKQCIDSFKELGFADITHMRCVQHIEESRDLAGAAELAARLLKYAESQPQRCRASIAYNTALYLLAEGAAIEDTDKDTAHKQYTDAMQLLAECREYVSKRKQELKMQE
jgi:hypothetical protein